MNQYSIYDIDTGVIIGHVITSTQTRDQLNQIYSGIVEGLYDIGQYRIENDQVVLIVPDNANLIQQQHQSIRTERDQLLFQVDRVNPVWYAALTDQQQTELQTYRQALLDVPQQAGFPTEIDLPAKPTWL